jgi:enolase
LQEPRHVRAADSAVAVEVSLDERGAAGRSERLLKFGQVHQIDAAVAVDVAGEIADGHNDG